MTDPSRSPWLRYADSDEEPGPVAHLSYRSDTIAPTETAGDHAARRLSITLYRERDSWMADFRHADNAASVLDGFGGYCIPTPCRASMPAADVVAEIAALNPGHVIEVRS